MSLSLIVPESIDARAACSATARKLVKRAVSCAPRARQALGGVPFAVIAVATGMLRRALKAFGVVLLPQQCAVCGGDAGAAAVCMPCAAEFPRWPVPACPRCALPSIGGTPCGQCLRSSPAFDRTQAVFDYAFPLDRLVQALKYQRQLALAPFLGAELAAAVAAGASGSETDFDLLLPMPLHPRRLAERGFNQAVEIARPLARCTGVRLELAAVAKLRDPPPQAGLDRERRLRAPRQAFAAQRRLDGQRVLVIDDVMTTGATLDALAKCLKAAGAEWVGNLVLARTPLP